MQMESKQFLAEKFLKILRFFLFINSWPRVHQLQQIVEDAR